MFCSGDASKIIKPRFIPFIGDFSEYKTKIEKNNSKTLKIWYNPEFDSFES